MISNQAMARPVANALTPFKQAFDVAQTQFQKALPQTVARYLTPERLTKVALNAIGRTPALLACEPLSVLRAVMDAATLGLEAGSPLGHAYLVPYGKTCQLIIGYRGLIELARRSGNIQSVEAHCVFENDRFVATFGLDARLEHEPAWTGDRGALKAVYCVARFVGGGTHIDVMTKSDVDAIRARSKSGNNGPWKTDYNEMARKTVVRRAAKYWPLSLELADAMDIETKHGDASDDDVMIFNGDTGEVMTVQPEAKPAADKLLEKLQSKQAPDEAATEEEPTETVVDPSVVNDIADEEAHARMERIAAKEAKEREFIERGRKAKEAKTKTERQPGSD